MAAHRPSDQTEAASDRGQELLFEAAYSRRGFLVSSAAGAAGAFVLGGAPAGASMIVGPPSAETNGRVSKCRGRA